MPIFKVTDRDGNSHDVDASGCANVMTTLRDKGEFGVEGICGGTVSCGTCHVYIDGDWWDKVPEKHQDEEDMLEAVAEFGHRRETSRLCCQIPVTDDLDGLQVTVAPEDE